MTGTKTQEYQTLERESSNHLLERDSRAVLGRYEEAASHALQAGRDRVRMGQLCHAAGEYAEAVEDWLSATDCFLLATARKEAAEVLDALHKLESERRIPAERPDLVATLRERERGLSELDRRAQQLSRDFAPEGHQLEVGEEGALRYLLRHIRDLPGFALLHYAIFRQASALGQHELALRHLAWAATFDPDNANYIALLGHLHLSLGRPDQALLRGNLFLAGHPGNAGQVRVMVATALASGGGGRPPDQASALDVLRPLLANPETDVRERITALALGATFQYELGREQEFARLVRELDRLEGSIQAPEVREVIANLRGMLPHPEANGAREVRPGPQRLLPEEDRLRLFQTVKQEAPGWNGPW